MKSQDNRQTGETEKVTGRRTQKEKKKIGKVLTSKSVGTGPSSYEKKEFTGPRAVSQRSRDTDLEKYICPGREKTAVQ